MWVYVENPSPYGFQGNSPWIRLGTGADETNNYFEYTTNSALFNNAIGQWLQITLPVSGDSQWQRTAVGNPTLDDIDWLEIHADTWDHGFTVWYDGLAFLSQEGPLPPPTGFAVTPFYSTAYLAWDAIDDPNVAGYEVYRRATGESYGAAYKRVLRPQFTDYGLTPGATYYYKLLAIDGSGVPQSQFTTEYAVTLDTDPTPYSVHKNFEVLMAFYTGGYTADEVAALTAGLKLGLEFYWRTSVGKLNMDVTWLYIDSTPPGPDWGYATLQADVRSHGVQDNQFDLAYLVGQNLSGCLGGYVIFGSTCASLGTGCGVAYPGKDPNVNYTIAWTYTHEMHHALEAMENRTAGTPEVLFCHFPWAYPDPLGPTGWHMDWGPHFDGIALTNREYGDQWLAYPPPYDGYIECVDLDHDGLPDADDRVWMDEARLGSSAETPDTDGDGLSDLHEYSAYNFRGTSPTDPDTDDDGIVDGLDHQPLYAAPRALGRFTTPPTLDGTIEPAWTPIADRYYFTRDSRDWSLRVYGGYDADALYLAFDATRNLRFEISLDGSGEDGRFESPVRHVSGATDTYNSDNKGNHIGDSWADGNHIHVDPYTSLVEVWGRGTVSGAGVGRKTADNHYYTEIRIPRVLPGGAAYTWYPPDAPVVDGLTLSPGQIIGLALTLSSYSTSDGSEFSGVWTGVFETHSFVDFTLQQNGDLDLDDDFDLVDFAGVQGCAGSGGIPGSCELVDLDESGTVDVGDLDVFAALLTGPLQ